MTSTAGHSLDPEFGEEQRTLPTTREGWRKFVTEDAEPLALLPRREWKGLSEIARALYDEARIDHHAELVVAATPTIREVSHSGQRLVLLNRHQISARRGLIVTGAAGTGKTTAITQLGRSLELRRRRRGQVLGERLPVVYVTVPPAATPKMLAGEFARFLGLPLGKALNQAEITNKVCAVLCALGTELVLVDEIHNLNLRTRTGAEASDQLKYLSERLPATFVYAGIDVDSVGLFNGTRGKQIAGRFATIATRPFAYGTAKQRHTWQALIATLEQALRLHRHTPGSLVRLDGYLQQRTAGMIGSLSHLIRGAAIAAVLDGSERITRTSLDRIALDHAAEQHARAVQRQRPRTIPPGPLRWSNVSSCGSCPLAACRSPCGPSHTRPSCPTSAGSPTPTSSAATRWCAISPTAGTPPAPPATPPSTPPRWTGWSSCAAGHRPACGAPCPAWLGCRTPPRPGRHSGGPGSSLAAWLQPAPRA